MVMTVHPVDDHSPRGRRRLLPSAPRGTSLAHRLSVRTRRVWWPLLRDGVRPLFLLADICACVVAVGVVVLISEVELTQALTFTALIIWQFGSAGLYRSRLLLSILDDVPALIGRWTIVVGIIMLLSVPLWHDTSTVLMAGSAGALLILFRAVAYGVVHLMRAHEIVSHETLIAGDDGTAVEIGRRLRENRRYGLVPIGYLGHGSRDDLQLPVLGGPQQLPLVLEERRPKVLIIGRGALPEADLVPIIRACQRSSCEVFVVPWLHELQHVSQDMEFVWDVPLIRLRRAAHRSSSWRLKRVLDISIASVALLLLSPLMALCALGVLLEGGRGVIFRQERVGCDGRRFALMKFRSMRPVNEQESQTQWNVSTDNRVGPIGRLLRVSSLDELPQLINILRGDMSLVGPRPERPHFVDQFGDLYRGYTDRHRVPSGLTGWAQVHGLRGDTSIEDRARFDNFYIENWSLWLDMKIILKTAISVVKSPGS